MAKIPNFAGAEKLSLTDLQALADAVAGQERVLPPAPLSGRIGSRKYSLANFNRVDESTGVSIPANPGLIESVAYDISVSEPQINEGKILLPPSGGGGSDITEVLYTSYVSSPVIESGTIHHPYAQTVLEGSSVAGVVSGFIKSSNVSYPFAENGDIVLPWAQSVSSVYGLVCGVESNSAVTAPMITDGDIILPYAQYENGSSVTGLIAGVTTSAVSSPIIQNGKLILPEGGGTVLGLRDMYGNPIAWEDLPTAENAIVLSTHYVGSYKYDLKAYVSDGYLGLQIIQDFGS